MAEKTMKTLTFNDLKYEIVDSEARIKIEEMQEDRSKLIDATLSQSEKAADAKVVGDTLAEKVPVTRTINGKKLNEDIELSASDIGALSSDDIDKTLLIEGSPADAKVTGEKISDIETELSEITIDEINEIVGNTLYSGDMEVL